MDNDPIVLAHARALMTSHPAGATAFIEADLREPGKILANPALRETLDPGKPVALMLIAILMLFRDEDDPQGIVRELVDALPSGSYLTITHATADFNPQEMAAAVTVTRQGGLMLTPRTEEEVAAFLDGLDLVGPGVVPVLGWRPDPDVVPEDPRGAYYYAAMGRKP